MDDIPLNPDFAALYNTNQLWIKYAKIFERVGYDNFSYMTCLKIVLKINWMNTINAALVTQNKRPKNTNAKHVIEAEMQKNYFKVIPGEAGFRTDCFKIWVYNTKDIILLTSIVVSCPPGICLLSI